MTNFKLQIGQSLVELLLVIGLCAVVLPILLVAFISSREGKAQQYQRAAGVALLREGTEAVRSVREKGWSYLAANGTFHPDSSGSSWSLIAGPQTVGSFTRQIVISDVNRGACPGPTCGEIVAVGTPDISTKQVVTTVSWGLPMATTISNTLYLTRYLGNNAFTETTNTQFNLGTKTGVDVRNDFGGEVILGPEEGNWCQPNSSIVEDLNLPKSGVANAVTAIEGGAFAGTGENASGESFVNINVTDTNPPVASILGIFNDYKTNDVFGEDNYGYIATDTNAQEITIISITTSPYTVIGWFDAPGITDANSVYIVGDTGYMTQGARLRNFDLLNCGGGNRTGSCPPLDPDGAAISGTGTSVYVVGIYAFVSIGSGTRELEIFDVSNPSNIVQIGRADVDSAPATDVFVNPTADRAYIVTNASSTRPEFFIIDTANKYCSDCPDIARYNAGTSTNLKAVEVIEIHDRAVVVGEGGEEYQVIDISSGTGTLPGCGGMQVDAGIRDSASVLEADGDAYSYIVTGDVSSEFKIILGGDGQYISSGAFESNTFDPGFSAAYNRFDATLNRPINTDIKFQVAVQQDCVFAPSDFVGPSGTSTDYFETSVTTGTQIFSFALPTNVNSGQCFRYKAYLSTTDSAVTPTLHDITVNYSL